MRELHDDVAVGAMIRRPHDVILDSAIAERTAVGELCSLPEHGGEQFLLPRLDALSAGGCTSKREGDREEQADRASHVISTIQQPAASNRRVPCASSAA